ncbi:MAG: 3-deoxy-7-phosphoheptulonate synthase [Eubacteriaceae bacterium]|nr:3-deoxy-7-phosphoheptulonate synthase [Eubacteriaceae bacterium]
MIIVLKSEASAADEKALRDLLSSQKIGSSRISGDGCVLYVCPGAVSEDQRQMISGFPFVEKLMGEKREELRCESEGKPFEYGGLLLGRDLCVIAGPCAVQEDQDLTEAAGSVARCGARMFRAGAFKPRTSPYSYQGMGIKAVNMIAEAGRISGLPTVCEIPSERYLDDFTDIDILQVGARNMQNFELLRALGRCGKPVLLKRGAGSTADELMYACEYIFSGGNERIILCERGIRTFETSCRNTLDVGTIASLKRRTGLPVFADPSHAAGSRDLVEALSLAAVAAGADGLMIETSDDPHRALSDSAQAVGCDTLAGIVSSAACVREIAYGR